MKQGRQRIDEEGKGRKRKGQQMKDEDQPKKHIQTEETHPTQIQT